MFTFLSIKMEAKPEEMSMARKQVIIELYSNGEKVSVIARTINRTLASVSRVVRRFESSVSVEILDRVDLIPLTIGNIRGFTDS